MRLGPWVLGVWILAWGACASAARRPLLVTVDDLPIAGTAHRDVAARQRLTSDLLATRAKHQIHAVDPVTWSQMHGAQGAVLLEQWREARHELGNEGDQHLDYTATDSTTDSGDGESGRRQLPALLAAHCRSLRCFSFPLAARRRQGGEAGGHAQQPDPQRSAQPSRHHR